MSPECPKCSASNKNIKKNGSFFRKSDSKTIERFKCKLCSKHFSTATISSCYRQNKRRINPLIKKFICSTMSMRRFSILFNVSRTTVKRKIEFLAQEARLNQAEWLKTQTIPFSIVEFDDLETFEHTKCKPITVSLFVEPEKSKILGYSVARIGAKGHLTAIARRKYGKRPNESFKKRDELFKRMKPFIAESAVIKSDKHPHYLRPLETHFPDCTHRAFKGKKGCVTGQGELKKTGFDPLFKINQSFGMLRDNLKRLTRRTWCTTKKLEALDDQIAIYVDFHNRFLKITPQERRKLRKI